MASAWGMLRCSVGGNDIVISPMTEPSAHCGCTLPSLSHSQSREALQSQEAWSRVRWAEGQSGALSVGHTFLQSYFFSEIPGSQTPDKNQRNTRASHRVKQTSWGAVLQPLDSSRRLKNLCKAWFPAVLFRAEPTLFLNSSVQKSWMKIKL